MDIPTVTAARMAELEAAADDEYGIPPSWLMEHAGRQVAAFVRDRADPFDRIHIHCGSGNNGGDGLVAARFLHSWGFDVAVIMVDTGLSGIRADRYRTLALLDVPVAAEPSGDPDIIVDALLGTGITGDPRTPYDDHIEGINRAWADTVAVDLPSGVNPDTGEPYDPHVRPDATLTLGLPKTGLRSTEYPGEVWLADIGLPPELYERFGIDTTDLFADASRIPVDG